MSNQFYILHVHGNRPYLYNHLRLYRELAQAKAQATRKTKNSIGKPVGDFTADIYMFDTQTISVTKVDI